MPELTDRRQFPRYPVRLPVLYRRKTPAPVKTGAGWTHDLSEGGACLELADRLEDLSVLQLVFQTQQGSLDLSGVVVWAADGRQKGEAIHHGLAFSDLSPRQREALRELIRPKG